MKWINIKKQKPPKCQRVLICDDCGDVGIEETDDVYNYHVGKMTWTQSYKFGNDSTVLYWMPLPEPPEAIRKRASDE